MHSGDLEAGLGKIRHCFVTYNNNNNNYKFEIECLSVDIE